MDAIPELLSLLSELVPLGIAVSIIGIFLFAVGTFIESKLPRKLGRAMVLLGVLILLWAVFK